MTGFTVQGELMSPPTAVAALEGCSMYVFGHGQRRVNYTSGNDLSATAWLRLDLRADSVDWLIETQNALFKRPWTVHVHIGYFYFSTATNQAGKRASHQAFWLLAKKAYWVVQVWLLVLDILLILAFLSICKKSWRPINSKSLAIYGGKGYVFYIPFFFFRPLL